MVVLKSGAIISRNEARHRLENLLSFSCPFNLSGLLEQKGYTPSEEVDVLLRIIREGDDRSKLAAIGVLDRLREKALSVGQAQGTRREVFEERSRGGELYRIEKKVTIQGAAYQSQQALEFLEKGGWLRERERTTEEIVESSSAVSPSDTEAPVGGEDSSGECPEHRESGED